MCAADEIFFYVVVLIPRFFGKEYEHNVSQSNSIITIYLLRKISYVSSK
jgi:hypothetical protein